MAERRPLSVVSRVGLAFISVAFVPFVLLAGCASHTASITMSVEGADPGACEAAGEAAGEVASEFALRNAVAPGTEPTVLTDGSIVLARYRTSGAYSPQIDGSDHTVYLTVFAASECRIVDLAITDYDDAHETEYVRRLRARLLNLLRTRAPDAEITTTEATTRTLPP